MMWYEDAGLEPVLANTQLKKTNPPHQAGVNTSISDTRAKGRCKMHEESYAFFTFCNFPPLQAETITKA